LSGLWFSPGSWVSSTNETDRHDIAEIFLKVVLNTINPNLNFPYHVLGLDHGMDPAQELLPSPTI
jgi:hypothetical protein